MKAGSAASEAALIAVQVIGWAGSSKIFGIATPKSAAIYGTGFAVSIRIMRIALDSMFHQDDSSIMKNVTYAWLMLGISHQVGKLLSQKICAVDITAKEAINLFVGILAVIGSTALAMGLVSFTEEFARGYARGLEGNL